MADNKAKSLDVWIMETNTVYRQVPYTVVTDWIQQGRLLEEDRVRPLGSAQWARLAEMPGFTAYLPKTEPFRAEDQAEALEAVQGDLTWKRPRGIEDDDVDMIPLIDVSLVLLIFFMMTAAVGGAGAIFDTPEVEHPLLAPKPEMVWIGVNFQKDSPAAAQQAFRYSLGKGDTDPGKEFNTREDLLVGVEELLREQRDPVEIRIRANRNVPDQVVLEIQGHLEKYKVQRKVLEVYGEVSEKLP